MQIYHPTEKANYSAVTVFDALKVWFSYNTIIAFWTPDSGLVVSENVWSKTTGKHLNWLEPDKKCRVSNDDFNAMLFSIMDRAEAAVRTAIETPDSELLKKSVKKTKAIERSLRKKVASE